MILTIKRQWNLNKNAKTFIAEKNEISSVKCSPFYLGDNGSNVVGGHAVHQLFLIVSIPEILVIKNTFINEQ